MLAAPCRWLARGWGKTTSSCSDPIEVKLVDPVTGAESPPDEPGELCARGHDVMAGYYNNPEATARAVDADGWLHTGDVGVFDADGYLTLKDRSKDLVISGGSNIYPREIEEVLLLHPSVREVSVIGRPHAEWGEIVVAYVVAVDLAKLAFFRTPGTRKTSLRRSAQHRVARIAAPWRHAVVAEPAA